ncbi:GH25 family lysozyme [Bacillus sp. MMSF_3328]|uniref:GH25 family lysozyme n=1 Tax=Bacillus sp. MMSF_3328 TaxID=3047080 RepID=UPI00273EF9FD|nr:GH25 family lysozyme [Bacillus sp. MMSF_3328]
MKARGPNDLLGADISSWQTITNAQQFFTDFKFVYIRAYGSDGKADVKFKEYVSLAKQYGVPSGGYYFARPTPGADLKTDAEAQAQLFIDKLQEAYGTGNFGDLIPMIDVEAYTGNKYDEATITPDSEMRENTLALTALMETSTSPPDSFGVTGGNFDGQGISHGAIQYNFGSGTLQPIWKDLINKYPSVVRGAITNQADYDYFVNMVLNFTKADQIAFGDRISDPANKHKVIEPWNTYFKNLGKTQESIDRQKEAAVWYFDQAVKWMDEYGLWTRRGFALLFDIAVQSGSIPQTVKDLILADFAAMNNTGKTPEQIETDKMVIIANRRADVVDPTWQNTYRQRKLAIANGSGTVYGSLLVDTTQYDAILEPWKQETAWGYPYAWGMTGTQLKDWILFFRTYFRSKTKARAIGIYANRYFLTETEQMGMSAADLQALAIMPLWLAEWNQTDGYTPATLGGWSNYVAWQYAMISDADTHGVSHGTNDLDHNITQELALIMPPKPVTDLTVTQKDNTTITVSWTPPADSDYIGSDIYIGGAWKAWVGKGTNTKDITVTTPIGGNIQVNVVSQDNYQDTTWSPNVIYTMVDMTVPVETPDQVINFVGRASGDNTRKIMVNGLASTELTPTQFGAEWWDYPAISSDDSTNMSYTISPSNGANNGHKIQYLFQFEVTAQPTPAEKLIFRVEGLQNQPFTLKFWDHVAGAWDEASKITFNATAAGYVTIETTNIAKHIGSDNRVYISMLSVNSVVDPAIAYTSRKYTITDNAAYRQTTGAYMGDTDKTIYTGGSSGLTTYIWMLLTDIKNSLNTSRGTPTAFLNINTTTAGLARLGFHKLATNPKTTTTPIPAYDATNPNLTKSLVVGWNRWDISNAAVGGQTGIKNVLNNGGYLGPVLYALTTDGSTSFSYGSSGGANAPNFEVMGDWQAVSGVTLGADYAELQVFRAEPVPPPPPKPEPVTVPEHLTYDYTEEDLYNMFHAKSGSRFVKFRFDLLDVNENKIRELDNVEHCEVEMNAFNTVKRTARIRLRETSPDDINYLNNRIQPFALFKLPDKYVQNSDGSRVLMEGKWVEYSLGIYLLSSPKKQEDGNQVFRDIEAYDGIVILEEDKFTDRYIARAGTKYTDAVIGILQGAGITKYNIGASDRTLPNDVEYEPGTEKTKPISDFLNAINFTPLYVDEYGYFTAQQYISPSDREADFRYMEDQFSMVANGVEEELDLYSVPNKWVAVYTSVDSTSQNTTSLTSTYTNDNPDSVTSTVSRGRTIVDYRKVDEIADQAALDEFVQRIAFEASQIFGKVRFSTAIMPYHGFQNVILLENSTLGINGKYAETSWRFALQAGALMEHEVRRVVNV